MHKLIASWLALILSLLNFVWFQPSPAIADDLCCLGFCRPGCQEVRNRLEYEFKDAKSRLDDLLKTAGKTIEKEHQRRVEQVSDLMTQQCSSAFDLITKPVIFSQGMRSAGSGQRIKDAVELLVEAKILPKAEFDGVQIRWCSLVNTDGMAPDRDTICLSEKVYDHDLIKIASLLAHEMRHIQQYRKHGTDAFKCNYAKAYLNCGGCQNDSNTYEADAYQFGDAAFEKLSQLAVADSKPQNVNWTYVDGKQFYDRNFVYDWFCDKQNGYDVRYVMAQSSNGARPTKNDPDVLFLAVQPFGKNRFTQDESYTFYYIGNSAFALTKYNDDGSVKKHNELKILDKDSFKMIVNESGLEGTLTRGRCN